MSLPPASPTRHSLFQGWRGASRSAPSRAPAACRAYFSARPLHVVHDAAGLSVRAAAHAVLSDTALRHAYDKATEFDVESMAVEEYLRRFTNLILTVNGLGSAGLAWGEDLPVEEEPKLLPYTAAGAPLILPQHACDAKPGAACSR